MGHSTYAERVYFGEAPQEPRQITRYEEDIIDAGRQARLGNIDRARNTLWELLEYHLSEAPMALPEYDAYRRRFPILDDEEAADDRARTYRRRAAWERVRDELRALILDPTAKPSREICQYGEPA